MLFRSDEGVTGATVEMSQAGAERLLKGAGHEWEIEGGGGGTVPFLPRHGGVVDRILDDIKKGIINSEEEARAAWGAAMGDLDYTSQDTRSLWEQFVARPDYIEASRKWTAGYLSPGDQDALDGWLSQVERGFATVYDVELLIRQQTGGPQGLDDPDAVLDQLRIRVGEEQGGAISAEKKQTIINKWINNGYTSTDQVVADIATAGNFQGREGHNKALNIWTAWENDGLFPGNSGIKEGDPGKPDTGIVTPQELRPGEGRFTQFARARGVEPELGGPDVGQVRREFAPFERAYDLSSRFGSLFNEQLRGIPTPEGYTAPTFGSYLTNRGDLSLQGSRMSSLDILKQLSALGIGGRRGMDIGFGDVYDPDTGDLLRGAEGKGLTRDEQNALIQDAAMAQYGTIGGGYVGGQLGRERDVFSARQAAGTTVQPAETANFFDYITRKYGLSLGG